MTNVSPAQTEDIELLPLIDQHTKTHLWHLPINPGDVEPVSEMLKIHELPSVGIILSLHEKKPKHIFVN